MGQITGHAVLINAARAPGRVGGTILFSNLSSLPDIRLTLAGVASDGFPIGLANGNPPSPTGSPFERS